MPKASETSIQIEKLLSIMKRLRDECPWDRDQTPHSLCQYLIEEAYEVVETIDKEEWEQLAGELGDLLLQIVFQSRIAEEESRFSFSDVVQKINEKMISRHPHVFGDIHVNSADDVANNWEHIKIHIENRKSILAGVPDHAPALLRAQRLQEKASRVGFDWENVTDVLTKIIEEFNELKYAIKNNDQQHIKEELGDFLFSSVNLCRFLNIVAEDALRETNRKFFERFSSIEKHYAGDYKKIKNATLAELDKIWEESKKNNK
jgi:tetrapyrrole methylase family protein/MazG family protein